MKGQQLFWSQQSFYQAPDFEVNKENREIGGCACTHAGSEKWPAYPFYRTQKFCSVKLLTVKNDNFYSERPDTQ